MINIANDDNLVNGLLYNTLKMNSNKIEEIGDLIFEMNIYREIIFFSEAYSNPQEQDL